MPVRDDSNIPDLHRVGHEQWLAMQTAYGEYRRTSEELESIYRSLDGSSTIEHLGLSILDGQQRAAFERYLEARLAFLEARCDASLGPIPTPGQRQPSAGVHPILQILAVLLMCATAFSLVRQQIHIRDLETARDENRAAQNQTREAFQTLAQKLDVMAASQHPPATQTEPPARKHDQAPASASSQKRRTGNFSLVPSRQLKRLGPVQVSVRLVDVQRKNVRLWVVSGRTTSEVKLYQNQPMWIKVDGQRQSLAFVIDRIATNRLDGHWIGSRTGTQEMKLSQLRPTLPAGP